MDTHHEATKDTYVCTCTQHYSAILGLSSDVATYGSIWAKALVLSWCPHHRHLARMGGVYLPIVHTCTVYMSACVRTFDHPVPRMSQFGLLLDHDRPLTSIQRPCTSVYTFMAVDAMKHQRTLLDFARPSTSSAHVPIEDS